MPIRKVEVALVHHVPSTRTEVYEVKIEDTDGTRGGAQSTTIDGAMLEALRLVEVYKAANAPREGLRRSKNPAAVALSQLSNGASKGGHARAKALTPAQRREAAKKAVNARWGKPLFPGGRP